jgi:formylglycine-generating enzyme required for sulfatase activity
MQAYALGVALISPILAAGASGDGVRLGGETMSSNTFHFSFPATAGQTYPIAVSVDLVHWSLLMNVMGGGSALEIADVDTASFQQRFYQIAVPVTPVTNMVYILPGTFTMGSPNSEVGRGTNEAPLTEVTISRGFWMGKYEVTQEEYKGVIGTNNSIFQWSPKLPVDLMSWSLASNYCYKLTLQERAAGRLPTGYVYRLPTEAEWEYSCRAGTATPFGIGDGKSLSSAQANFNGNFPYGGAAKGQYLGRTTICGTYAPNAWGLYDMHGNLWEFCQDWYGPYPGGKVTDPKGPATGSAHVLRGGAYDSPGQGCRSAKRDSRSPDYRNTINGFRVVLASDP